MTLNLLNNELEHSDIVKVCKNISLKSHNKNEVILYAKKQSKLIANNNFFKFQNSSIITNIKYFSHVIIVNYINQKNKHYIHQKNEHPMPVIKYRKNNIELGIVQQ